MAQITDAYILGRLTQHAKKYDLNRVTEETVAKLIKREVEQEFDNSVQIDVIHQGNEWLVRNHATGSAWKIRKEVNSSRATVGRRI